MTLFSLFFFHNQYYLLKYT